MQKFVDYPHIASAIRRLPPDLFDALADMPGIAIVAGGFLRAISMGNKPHSDIDVFFTGVEPSKRNATILKFLEKLVSKQPYVLRANGALVTNNAVTVTIGGYPIQLIRGFDGLPGPASVLDAFDLTLSKAAVWVSPLDTKKMLGVCTVSFLRDIGARAIVYENEIKMVDPVLSARRIEKFMRQGFTMSADALLHYVDVAAPPVGGRVLMPSSYDSNEPDPARPGVPEVARSMGAVTALLASSTVKPGEGIGTLHLNPIYGSAAE